MNVSIKRDINRKAANKKMRRKLAIIGLVMISPILVVLGFLNFYPIAYSIYLSFTNYNSIHTTATGFEIVGIANFVYIFGSNALRQVIMNTIVWSLGSIAVMVPAGFILALIINQKGLLGKRVYRTLFLFPWAFPAFLTVLVWSNMLAVHGGVVDEFLNYLHIKSIPFLTNPGDAMLSLILVNFWLSFPYYTYVYTASIQSIPKEMYEAAEMDGYGTIRTLRYVTLPLIKRQFAFVTIFGFIFTWNNFYVPFLLTGGGPGRSTQILITYAYTQAFSELNYSLGAAYSIVSILILLVFVIVANHYTKMMRVLY
ncbi:carbohydrate ABC transporter permease [Caldiplasma sukawensis]